MSSNTPAIIVDNVSKRYEMYEAPIDRLKQFMLPFLPPKMRVATYAREFWALRDITFEINRGDAVGILGRNGSGKSTLLQIIAGTLTPSSGSAITHGRIAALLELGSGFNPDFTGRENVYLNGSLLGFRKEQIDNLFDDIASFADIGVHIDQPVKTYSSGMLLRLAFAVQVQVQPDILIVDEALAVGDALFQKRCFQKLEKLRSDGVTLLFVSHDQESVRTLTNRALLLQHGEIKAWGLSSEVVLEYRRQLHAEESSYFASIANQLTNKAKIKNEDTASIHSKRGSGTSDETSANNRSTSLSFGEGEVEIVSVETLDADDQPCSVYYPGDTIKIRVGCIARVNIDKLNVALRIRNKEGVKIYSWGTLNQDIQRRFEGQTSSLFWDRKFNADESFTTILQCECSLGTNLYEIQASVSYEETPDYLGQRILHWIDEAAFFQVLMKRDEYFFGGVTDLHMKSKW